MHLIVFYVPVATRIKSIEEWVRQVIGPPENVWWMDCTYHHDDWDKDTMVEFRWQFREVKHLKQLRLYCELMGYPVEQVSTGRLYYGR